MRIRLFLFAAPVMVLAPLAAAGDYWPGFRGPTADGHAPAEHLATAWSEKENIRWKTPIHGKAWSSPVVLGNDIWLTTADEVVADKVPPAKGGAPANPVTKVTLFALCVDRKTGEVKREIKLAGIDNPPYCIPFNSYASSTPYLEPGRLYAHFGSNGTWCIDTATGNILWERRDLKCDHFRGAASSPVVYGDLLYLIFDGFDLQYVTALDKHTGKSVWKTDRNIRYKTDNGDFKKAYATPVLLQVDGKPELICPSAESTIAYDPKTGAELWRLQHGGMNGSARPVMGNGLLYLTSGHTAKLLAARTDGSGVVTKDTIAWEAGKGVPTRPSILLVDGLVFMVADNGVASCLDAATGKPYWTERLDGEFSASPILAGKNIYCCNQTGKTFVFAADKTYSLVAENRLDGGFMASPAVAGEDLILRTRTHLYCVATAAK
jgi:outer membrane protein assembly factor BamB